MAAEFALIIPIVVTVLIIVTRFGVALSQRLELNEGVRAGATEFAAGRSNDTVWSDTLSRFHSATPGMNASDVTLSLNVDGMSCSSDTACRVALAGAAGRVATISATYPCDLRILSFNPAPGYTLASAATRRVL